MLSIRLLAGDLQQWVNIQAQDLLEQVPVMSDDMPEQQDGEEMSHDSEDGGPGSPREGLDSPCELKSEEKEPKGSERVTCTNCPDSNVTAVLSSRELWQLFDAIGTEMIVTRRGR